MRSCLLLHMPVVYLLWSPYLHPYLVQDIISDDDSLIMRVLNSVNVCKMSQHN